MQQVGIVHLKSPIYGENKSEIFAGFFMSLQLQVYKKLFLRTLFCHGLGGKGFYYG